MVTLGELQARTETLLNTSYTEDRSTIPVYNMNKKKLLQFVFKTEIIMHNR